MFIGSSIYILSDVEQINPKSIAFLKMRSCFEFDLHLYPFIECHGKDKREESDDIEDTDKEETISYDPFTGLIEFLKQFLLLFLGFVLLHPCLSVRIGL